MADSNSDPGVPAKPRRQPQAADEVIIRGPKKGADEARDELLSLYQYLQDNAHSSSITVARALLPSLIGTSGRELTNLRMSTGAQIDIPSKDNEDADRVEVKIRGNKPQIEKARKLIQQKSKTFDETISRTMAVDSKHHQALVGPKGESRPISGMQVH